MKKFNIYAITTVLIGMGLSSCQKKFDPSTYAPQLSIAGYNSASQVAASNLVSYWAFNGGLTDSVNGGAGTATGTGFAGGIKGQSLQGALNSYALTDPDSKVTGLTSFTLSEWVNTPPPSTGIIGLFSLANTKEFWGNIDVFVENGSTNTNGKLRIHVNPGSGDKTLAVDNIQNLFDRWVNITISYDEATSNIILYVNGAKVSNSTTTLSGALHFANPGKIVFGCVQFQTTPSQTSSTGKQDWASYLTGTLDEVRIYNKALTPEEIGALVKLEGRGK
ncbi:hypothetical protein GCM10023149_20220 [Mucilaginibacter gynuensis]|uniref:Concanavalin A-like lectin/glucanase superfamily protein n=1 Tax=Mucilaginibacter gynuensis TaxID=1302236 RepID=A0ABP8GB87_9SPHI